MESYISYTAGGQPQKIPTQLVFNKESNDHDYIAAQVFLQVSHDRDEKLIQNVFRKNLSEAEKREMSDKDIDGVKSQT